MKNIFVRGKPGSGKTTLVMKVVESRTNKSISGFYTEEVRENGVRVGFIVRTLKGEERVLSHVRFQSGPRVGKYRVNLQVIDSLVVQSLQEGVKKYDIIIIDEIGKMEMLSKNFQTAVRKALDSSKRVLATIPVYTNTFLASLKARNDVEIFNIDVDNRDRLVEEILNRIQGTK
jgi:nucleoside-triphosphatase THEP1